jgi:ABC-type polysaccharide/polyol phosphate export permease
MRGTMSTKEAAITAEIIIEQSASSFTKDSADEILFPCVNQKKLAWQDISSGFCKWNIWLMLAYQDIKLRYRRSVLGPFWITISMAITVYTMGFLYGHLFHMDLQQYYPYLVSGMLTWTLISTAVTELTDTFITSDGLLKQIKLPYTTYIHRVIARNFIIFFHNLLVMLPIYFLFSQGAKINFNTLLLIPGLALLYLNALIFGIALAILGARYRDISQIIKSLVQVVFFMTPVMWSPSILPAKDRIFVYINPAYSYIELVRAPLIGTAPSLLNISIILGMTLVGSLLCLKLFIPYRSRLIYWL